MGWSEQQLAEASPAYLSALRWLILTETLWPKDTSAATAPLPEGPSRQRAEAYERRAAANEALAELRTLLFPED